MQRVSASKPEKIGDRAPITPIVRPELPFEIVNIDVIGPIQPPSGRGHKYVLCMMDQHTRWPEAVPLRSLTAKNACDSLLQIFSRTGIPSIIASDQGTNFKSALTQEFTKRIGSSPRFSCPGYPASNGLVERWNKVLKDMIHHVIREDPRSWDRQLPFLLFAYREVPNTTTGVSPFRLLYGREARGPLAILKSSWAGEIHLPTNISQSAADYLQEMKINMEKAAESASLTAAQKQKGYGDYFNKRSSVKNFSIGEQVVLLIPDSSNKIYARWTGPGEIIQHHPPHSYKVKLPDGTPFVYRIPESLKIKVDEQIEELVRLDLIEESDAEIAYPIVCVNKKDGTLRLCVDFRALNSESVSDDFPMEDAVELIHSIGRANIITTLDLLKGYWAIPMAEDSKILHLSRLIGNSTVSSVPLEKLKLNICHIIGSGKHEPDPEKTAVINNLPVPKTKKELRSVLDCVITIALVEAPSLYSPVPDKPYTIHSDASQIGIAACLSQKCGDKCYPIAYASQKLSHNVTVNGDRYRAKITNFFIPELNNHDVQELWFQQDGATCHTARATIDLLKDTLGDRLISRFGPVNWPPRSCDLTPLDYFLWGYVKSLVYADKPQTLDHLEDNIRRVIADIRPQMLEKVIENWTSRLDYIRASRGSPMPEIIFKM
ncbi:hypothetical protein TNCV_4350591 [Trichonephila clavipes]|nr:hypothetical protein TNCV_4350591 [Trichonephila clavipes]